MHKKILCFQDPITTLILPFEHAFGPTVQRLKLMNGLC